MSQEKPIQRDKENDWMRISRDIWREAIGEADVRFYLYESVLSLDTEVQSSKESFQSGLFRYFYNQIDSSDMEPCFLMLGGNDNLTHIQKQGLHLQMDTSCAKKSVVKWQRFLTKHQLHLRDCTVQLLVDIYHKLVVSGETDLLQHWRVYQLYLEQWHKRLVQCIQNWRFNYPIDCIWNRARSKFRQRNTDSNDAESNTLILGLVGPAYLDPVTRWGEESHYLSLVITRKQTSTELDVYSFDSGKAAPVSRYYTRHRGCSRLLLPEVQEEIKRREVQNWNTWEVVELENALHNIENMEGIHFQPIKSTPFPLQLEYDVFREKGRELISDLQDTWCQTWSFLFGLQMLEPTWVTKVHQVLTNQRIMSRFLGEDIDTLQVLRYGKILEEAMKPDISRESTIGIRYNWLVGDYYNLLSQITQVVPSFSGCWLYACIRCLYPHLQKYLRQPEARGEGVSRILLGVHNTLCKNKDQYHQTSLSPYAVNKHTSKVICKNLKKVAIVKHFCEYTSIFDVIPDYR